MIPCPTCVVALQGAGGRCRAHQAWGGWRTWLPGDWSALDGGAEIPTVARRRGELFELVRAEVAALPRMARGVFFGFWHHRASLEGVRRPAAASAIASVVVSAVVACGVLGHDQVDGIAHLFFDGRRPMLPTAHRPPGVLVLCMEWPA